MKPGEPWESTLWTTAPTLQVQVTVPPAWTVSTAGLSVEFRLLRKKLLPTVTLAVVGMGAGVTAVALKVTGDPVSPSAVAVMMMGPAVPPAMTVTADSPDAALGTDGLETVAPVAAQPTAVPATGFPCSSSTRACTGNANWVPVSAVWLSPAGTLERLAARPAAAVAVNVTGDPAAPVTVALAV